MFFPASLLASIDVQISELFTLCAVVKVDWRIRWHYSDYTVTILCFRIGARQHEVSKLYGTLALSAGMLMASTNTPYRLVPAHFYPWLCVHSIVQNCRSQQPQNSTDHLPLNLSTVIIAEMFIGGERPKTGRDEHIKNRTPGEHDWTICAQWWCGLSLCRICYY